MDALFFLSAVFIFKYFQRDRPKGRIRVKTETTKSNSGYFKSKIQREHRVRTSALSAAWNSMTFSEKCELVNLIRRNKTEQSIRLDWALKSGINVCVDLNYEKEHATGEIQSLVRQLSNTYAMLKRAAVPCHLHLTSLSECNPTQSKSNTGSSAIKQFWLLFVEFWNKHAFSVGPAINMRLDTISCLSKTGYQNWKISKHSGGPETVAMMSALEPQKTLVYLSPDAPEPLLGFDPTCVYVVGAIVDRSVKAGLTLDRANSLGAICRRFPLQEFVPDRANHVLNIDCSVHIICSYLETSDWVETFKRTLPPRKCIKGGKRERYRLNKLQSESSMLKTDKADSEEAAMLSENEQGKEANGTSVEQHEIYIGGNIAERAVNSRWIRWIEREVGLEFGEREEYLHK
jgi:hypothetical protein